MIMRKSFVSNSSSSSFIIIGQGDKVKISRNPVKKGELKFDYGTYLTPEDRFNFVLLQFYYKTYADVDDIEYDDYNLRTLYSFCTKHNIDFYKVYKDLLYKINRGSAYIDHQSILTEDYDMEQLLYDEELLENFILCNDTVFRMFRD